MLHEMRGPRLTSEYPNAPGKSVPIRSRRPLPARCGRDRRLFPHQHKPPAPPKYEAHPSVGPDLSAVEKQPRSRAVVLGDQAARDAGRTVKDAEIGFDPELPRIRG